MIAGLRNHECSVPARRVDIALAGATGRVGQAFAALLAARAPGLRAGGLDVGLAGVARNGRWRWDERRLPFASPFDLLCGAPAGTAAEFLGQARRHREAPLALVDCTASEELAGAYAGLIADGIAVVTPNKRGSASTLARWRSLHGRLCAGAAPYRYSATVGAGMPVLSTVRRLRRRGDSIRGVRAVLSGSLSAVLSAVQEGTPFSHAVAHEHERGCTEPHPGEDLSGEDVARKLLIVLREGGIALERADIFVEPLVPGLLLQEEDVPRFLAALPAFDAIWRTRADAARAAGRRLVFAAEYDGTRTRAAVRALPVDDSLARLRSGENRIEILSDHDDPVPLGISGPGAGPDVTAANVLSDLLDAARGAWGAPYTGVSGDSRAASA